MASEQSAQIFGKWISIAVGTVVSVILTNGIRLLETIPEFISLALVIPLTLVGIGVGHILHGTVKQLEDESISLPVILSTLGIFWIYSLTLFDSISFGYVGTALVLTLIMAFITSVANTFTYDLVRSYNKLRLKKSAKDDFKKLRTDYETAVEQAEQQAEQGALSEEILAESRSCRTRCEDFKDKYDIKQTTYKVDERLETLESQLEQDQARERLDELTEQVGELTDQLQSAEDAGNYDRALELLDEVETPLSKAEEIREEHGFDVEFGMRSGEVEQVRRSLIEGKYQNLLSAAKESGQNAEEQLDRSNYERARQYASEAIQQTDRAKNLAEEWVFLSEQDCVDEREAAVSLQIKAIGNQVAEMETDLQSREGQESVGSKLGTLETAVKDLERLHQTTTQSDIKKDIVTTAQKTQTVLLAGRILSVEQDASQACERFRRGAETQAKELFDDLVTRLDDIRDRAPDDALGEYETELNDLQSVCETNAERARRQDLGLDSGLTMESVYVLGSTLRGESQAQFESASSGNTELFDPSDVQDSTGDTEVFDPSEGGSAGDTEVFDASNPDG